MDNQKLSARVEALEGPCRECDCLIENTLGLAKFERDPRVIYGAAYYTRVEPKPYTASLAAAMSLVPEGLRWCVDTCDGVPRSFVEPPHPYEGQPYWGNHVTTPALALCAAALKARGL